MDWIERLNNSTSSLPLGNGQVELLQWEHAEHLPDNVPHRHTYFEICLVGEYGQGRFTVEGHPYTIGPGDIFFARPGIVHQIQNTADPLMELYWVSWGWNPQPKTTVQASAKQASHSEIDALLKAFSDSDVLVIADEEKRVTSLWQALRSVSSGMPMAGSELQINALMSSLLLALAQAGSTALRQELARVDDSLSADRLGRLAVRYIHDNLYRSLGLNEIAAHIHVSPRHLSRLLQRLTGVSPAAYIEQARIDRACAMLRHGESSIKEVAAEVGYEDVHHFTRAFTRCCGCPPGRFRRDPTLLVRGPRRDILS